MCIGGQTGSGRQVITESWNGSSWTEVGDLNISKGAGQGAGTYTSAISTGGDTTPTADAETWNGSAWTEVSNMNRSIMGWLLGVAGCAAESFTKRVDQERAELALQERDMLNTMLPIALENRKERQTSV